MKAIKYFVIAVILLVTGCNKPSPVPEQEQYDRYIFFSSEVETKGTLIDSPASMQNFGIVGYKYDNALSWANTTAADRSPVFYDLKQAVPIYRDTINVSTSGNCTYAPIQGWSNSKKYSFFAYYPLSDTIVTLSNTDNGGTPTITYTMDVTSVTDFKESMVDVMTASQKDVYGYESIGSQPINGDVNLSFDHRLSCLAVYVKKVSSCDIELNSITLNISGIKYNQVNIPLDGGTIQGSSTTPIASQEFALALTDDEKSGAVTTGTGTELSDKLIFIPQTEPISIQAVVNYTRKASGYIADVTNSITLPVLTTSLTEKTKHLIQLNFSDSTVSVNGIANSTWIKIEDVYDTFN